MRFAGLRASSRNNRSRSGGALLLTPLEPTDVLLLNRDMRFMGSRVSNSTYPGRRATPGQEEGVGVPNTLKILPSWSRSVKPEQTQGFEPSCAKNTQLCTVP
jgi:hypothetical protein